MNYKNLKIFPLSLIIISLLCTACTAISTLNAGKTEGIESEVDKYINAYVKMDQFSGSVLIAMNDQLIVKNGYGMANYEHDIPNDSKTIFRIASLTKPFTAMAILILEEQNLLSLDDYLIKYISDYPNGDKIQIIHLLTHTSGIPDHTELPDFNQERRVFPYDILETIETFKYKPLEFLPGEESKYSNSGYIILGHIIEIVSKTSYDNYIDQNIFKPLGMINSGFVNMDEIIKHRAYGYSVKEIEIIQAAYRNISNAHASGALYSTIEDLYLWDRSLYTDKLVEHKSLERMFTSYKGDFGLGWAVVDVFNRKMAGLNGETEGFSTNITRFTDEDACIIILSNYEQTPVGKMSIEIAAILFGEEYTIPIVREIIRVDPNILNDYVGKYELQPNVNFIITKKDTYLYCQLADQDKIALYPESESEFFFKVVDAQISFIRDESEKVEKLVLHQGGREFEAKKIE